MERAETTATLSPPIRILPSILGLTIVAGAVLVNFRLLAGSMAEMVGGGNYIGSFKVADISASVILLVELSMGLYLMEAWGVTNIWMRQILPDEIRSRIFWVAISVIVLLALTEAGVIYVEDVLLAKGTAVGMGGSAVFLPVPLWARMGLALFLPFLIAFWAVPFEALLRVFRTPRV